MVGREVWVKCFLCQWWDQSNQVWVSLIGKTKMTESKMKEFKMAAIIKLSQNEWVKFFMQMVGREVWVKFILCQWWDQSNQVWVSLIGKTKMDESKMKEFKMAAIIKLSQNEWVKFSYVQNGWIEDRRFQDSCNHQVESEWMSEVFLCKCWKLILAGVSEFERKN